MTTCAEKVEELRSLIESALARQIGRDKQYWLLDVPYHSNVGDTLIWQGEMDFLRQFGGQCVGMFSFHSLYLPQIPKHSLVLFHGGGNLGDLWEKPANYRKRLWPIILHAAS